MREEGASVGVADHAFVSPADVATFVRECLYELKQIIRFINNSDFVPYLVLSAGSLIILNLFVIHQDHIFYTDMCFNYFQTKIIV